jgi:anti-sigma28 factor (negative regulator of flagellin synthesis)
VQSESVRAKAANSQGDRVEISSSDSVSRDLASQDAKRAERVQALKEQYQSGQYQSDPMATAQAMISSAMAKPS